MGMIGGDIAALFQRPHPAQARRRGQADLGGEINICHTTVGLERVKNLEINVVDGGARHSLTFPFAGASYITR